MKPPFTDTSLTRIPLYYRHFALSMAKKSPYIFSKLNPGHPVYTDGFLLRRSRSWSRRRSHKRDGIWVRRIRTFPFLPTPLTTPSLTFRFWSSENQIVGVGSSRGSINQSQCTFPRFVIGLVLRIRFCFRLVRGNKTLFSLDCKMQAKNQNFALRIICRFWCRLHVPKVGVMYSSVRNRSSV